MLRQLISKWGIMSIDLQTAFDNDDAVIAPDGTPNYLDAPTDNSEPVSETPAVDFTTGEVAEEVSLNDV
jgi:recombination protein RecT